MTTSRPPSHRVWLSALVDRNAAAAFVVQTLSYAVLVGLFGHGDATPLVELVRQLPTPLAAVLGVFALPAAALTAAVGALVEFALGRSPQGLGVGLVSESDLLFLVVAALLSVGIGRALARYRERSAGRQDQTDRSQTADIEK